MCYAAPLVGAVAASLAWKRTKSVKLWWLNLMFYGGAFFGVIDHWWNGELFLISKNIGHDLLLGVVITACIFIAWAIIIAFSRVNPTLASYININTTN